MRPDRPHQARVLAQYADLVRDGARKVLIQLPTGGGKTHLYLRAAEMAIGRGLMTLVLAHREELVMQPARRIQEDGWPAERMCVWRAGRPSGNRDAPLHIASVQTLLAMPDDALATLLSRVGLCILDEARHYKAPDWYGRLAAKVRTGAYLLGLDATPVRADGRPLGDLFDHLLQGASVGELVADGYLVPHTVIAPAEPQDELAQDPVDAYIEHAAGKRAIIFCGTVTYAKDVARRLSTRGYPAEMLDANTHPDVRRFALRRFVAGETLALCNVRILTEGTDLPPTEAIIHACRPGSLSDWIQKGGRGLRPSAATGKSGCLVVDLPGAVHEYGLLDDPHVWSLGGSGVRLAEGLPPIGQCPKCFAWVRSASRCGRCGYVAPVFAPPPPRIRAADLIEVRRGDAVDVRQTRLDKWALAALRSARNPWQIAHIYAGTYDEKPARHMVIGAIERATETIAAEARARQEADEPLFRRRMVTP